MLGEKSHLVFPVQSFRDWTDAPVRLMEVWDSIVWLQECHQGLHKYGPLHTNRLYGHVLHPHQGGYMHAFLASTAYQNGTGELILNPKRLRIEGIWGPAHEIGHMNQVTPFKWSGMGEVSNNVSSMYTRYHFGGESFLTLENTYELALEHFVNKGILRAESNDAIYDKLLFIKLVPFWQLELYFERIKGYTDFYADLYEHLRKNPNPATDALCQLNFIKVASDIGKTDLSEFFETVNLLKPGGFNITQQQVDTYKNNFANPSGFMKHRNAAAVYAISATGAEELVENW